MHPVGMPPYEVSTDASLLDLQAVHAFLASTYWSPGIPLEVVERAVSNSVCVGAYAGASLVGFARVVTDKATFAYLADVFVLEAHRGKGLSKQMLRALFQLPELQGLRRVMLATRDAHALYASFGFTPLSNPSRFMERHNPNAYSLPSGAA
jgi:GNAT superfamily N-acetyltransferase